MAAHPRYCGLGLWAAGGTAVTALQPVLSDAGRKGCRECLQMHEYDPDVRSTCDERVVVAQPGICRAARLTGHQMQLSQCAAQLMGYAFSWQDSKQGRRGAKVS